jgi:tetratricopeptide (TPR) repeat protein
VSLQNDPTNVQVYLDLVDIYNFSGQAEKIPVFLKANLKSAGNVNQAVLKTLLAKYYADAKDNVSAIKYYEEVLVIDPANTAIKQEIERLRSL